jgi:hypothetical protein
MKVYISEPEDTAVVRQWLCKNASTATESRDRRNRHERNNRGIVGGGVLCWVRAEAVSSAYRQVWRRGRIPPP